MSAGWHKTTGFVLRACVAATLLTQVLVASGCGETTGAFVDIPFQARGTAAEPFEKDGWEVVLEEAEIGFGPIFFCTTNSSNSGRCSTAILEFLDGVTLDGLDPSDQEIGLLFGTTGTVNTAFFDYGIVWLLTQPQPEALEGVPGGPAIVPFRSSDYVPQGHSGRFRGTATCVADPDTCCAGAATCPSEFEFIGNIDVVVENAGTPAVNGVRTVQEITRDPVLLTIVFDPNAWWSVVDYARLAALDDGSGEVVLSPTDPDYSAVIQAMTANQLPTFTWSGETTE